MHKTTLWDVIINTIKRVGIPLSAIEIWEKANELGTIVDFKTEGKTPWATIAAYCYTDIQKNVDTSLIVQTSQRPAKFFLRELAVNIDLNNIEKKKDNEISKREKPENINFNERDLHRLLVAFAHTDTHFKAYLKTIYHENSNKSRKGHNEWLHPDLVGVYFPFSDYEIVTREVQDYLKFSSIKLFSFEMKTSLNFNNLRQSYFQAVSNSSWANEGYLVTLFIEDDTSFRDEIRRLNNSFGIGIIKLNIDNIYNSDILFPSRINPEIDWDTVNRLVNENKDFKEFLKSITEDCQLQKIKSNYDKILGPDDIRKYIKEKGFSKKHY